MEQILIVLIRWVGLICKLNYHYNLQKGSTPLLIACEYQKTEMFKILHDKSSEVTQQTKVQLHILYDIIVASTIK